MYRHGNIFNVRFCVRYSATRASGMGYPAPSTPYGSLGPMYRMTRADVLAAIDQSRANGGELVGILRPIIRLTDDMHCPAFAFDDLPTTNTQSLGYDLLTKFLLVMTRSASAARAEQLDDDTMWSQGFTQRTDRIIVQIA